jgi:hypothetical protein
MGNYTRGARTVTTSNQIQSESAEIQSFDARMRSFDVIKLACATLHAEVTEAERAQERAFRAHMSNTNYKTPGSQEATRSAWYESTQKAVALRLAYDFLALGEGRDAFRSKVVNHIQNTMDEHPNIVDMIYPKKSYV